MVAPVLGERAVYVSSEGIGVWVLKIRARLCAAVPGRMKVIWFCVVVSCTSMASDAASTFSLVSIKVTRARACAHFCVVVAALRSQNECATPSCPSSVSESGASSPSYPAPVKGTSPESETTSPRRRRCADSAPRSRGSGSNPTPNSPWGIPTTSSGGAACRRRS
eukprot:CAMPEP_0194274570 /NCGR_PEP_ID=MMETSP0169-20130528/7623_1 /TAXON_ID=218684 /ORGANISM="Corethron pennatum, Strain L29A3" /LENGTH=164 /DNA_ID=CAMNT_0039017801 /DNA_START=472 /DNA_END=966 /DNA_ORIENTATION=+